MTYAKNGNGRIWKIVGGLAAAFLLSVTATIGFAMKSTEKMATNTTKIVMLEEKLNSMDKKLDRLLERTQ